MKDKTIMVTDKLGNVLACFQEQKGISLFKEEKRNEINDLTLVQIKLLYIKGYLIGKCKNPLERHEFVSSLIKL